MRDIMWMKVRVYVYSTNTLYMRMALNESISTDLFMHKSKIEESFHELQIVFSSRF